MTKYLAIVGGLLLSIATTSVNAQTLKFGHINSTQLLGMMPETKNADSSLNKFGTSLEAQLKTMTAE